MQSIYNLEAVRPMFTSMVCVIYKPLHGPWLGTNVGRLRNPIIALSSAVFV